MKTTLKFAFLSLVAGVLAAGAGSAQAMPVAKAAGAIQSQAADVVQVREGGRHHFRGGGHRFHGGGGFHHRRHFRHHRFWGPRVHFYGGGRGGCYWLKERALDTGSRYWWRRYQACRNGW